MTVNMEQVRKFWSTTVYTFIKCSILPNKNDKQPPKNTTTKENYFKVYSSYANSKKALSVVFMDNAKGSNTAK